MTASIPPASPMPALLVKGRKPNGKGAIKILRREGKAPAVAYGKTFAATPISVTPKEVATILTSERGQNTVIKMTIESNPEAKGANDGKSLLVMIKDYSYHPVTRALEHVDFVEVKLDQVVLVNVPLVFTGKPAGVVKGGIIRQVFRTLPVQSLPDRVPLRIEVDITHLELGEHVATKDLKLGEGVSVTLPEEQTLIAVVTPEKDRSAEDDAAAAAAAPAGATAAAAPAAGAAAGKDAKAAAPAAAAKDAKKK